MINNSKEYLRQFEVQDHETISIEEAMLLNNERYKKSNDPMDLVFVRPTPPVKKIKAPKVSPIDLAKSAQITALSSFYSGKYGSLTLSEFLKDRQITWSNRLLGKLNKGSGILRFIATPFTIIGGLVFVIGFFIYLIGEKINGGNLDKPVSKMNKLELEVRKSRTKKAIGAKPSPTMCAVILKVRASDFVIKSEGLESFGTVERFKIAKELGELLIEVDKTAREGKAPSVE